MQFVDVGDAAKDGSVLRLVEAEIAEDAVDPGDLLAQELRILVLLRRG